MCAAAVENLICRRYGRGICKVAVRVSRKRITQPESGDTACRGTGEIGRQADNLTNAKRRKYISSQTTGYTARTSHKQTDRQADRKQRDRQTVKQTIRQAYRQTDNRNADRLAGSQTNRQTDQ